MWVESCFKVELPQDNQLQVNRWRDWKEAWRNQRPTIPDKELQQLAHLPLRLEQHCHRRRLHQLQDLHRPRQGVSKNILPASSLVFCQGVCQTDSVFILCPFSRVLSSSYVLSEGFCLHPGLYKLCCCRCLWPVQDEGLQVFRTFQQISIS